jgi:hypothetical protein
MKKVLILGFLFFLCDTTIWAQDPVWNQIQHNPLALNPAYASNPGQGSSFYYNTRNQWLNLPGPNKYVGSHLANQYSYVSPICTPWLRGKYNGLGTSLQINSIRAGEGRLGYFGFSNNIGTYLPLTKSHNRSLACYFGMGYSLSQYSIQWDNLTFSSQLDPYLGLVSSSPLVNPRYQNAPSNVSVSGQFGGFIHGNVTSRTYFRAGYGLFHFGPEIVTFFDQRERVMPRHSFHSTLTYFPKSKSGLRKDFHANYWILHQNFQTQYPLQTSETRLSVCNGGVVTNTIGLRSRYFLALNTQVDSWLYSIQFNTNVGMVSAGYEYTLSKLNNGRSGGTVELGWTLPIGACFGPKAFRKREPCFVEDLLMASEWKAVEKFSKTATSWGIQYSPITFIP